MGGLLDWLVERSDELEVGIIDRDPIDQVLREMLRLLAGELK
jgi:hypothetical protein